MKHFFRKSAFLAVPLFLSAPALAQDAPDVAQLASFVRWGGVFLSLFVIAGTVVVMRLVTGIANRVGQRFASQRMAIQKFESFARFLIYLAAASIVMGLSVRLDPAALTVIGASLGFAVGFAMRDLVAAFIAGVTIMFDRPFQVGDRVQYAGEYGDIIKIGLRSVRMNTLDHNVVTIPNNKILTDVSASSNYGALEMQVGMDFHIGADQNLAVATEIIHEACITSRFCFLDQPVPILSKQQMLGNCAAYHLKARPYVLDVKYEKQFETDVHAKVQAAFLEAGILPPAVLQRQMRPVPPPLLANEAGDPLHGGSRMRSPSKA